MGGAPVRNVTVNLKLYQLFVDKLRPFAQMEIDASAHARILNTEKHTPRSLTHSHSLTRSVN